MTGFHGVFKQATGFDPFPYQERWAEATPPVALASIPTGLGKTAAAILSWIWKRRFAEEAIRRRTPRRLIYCLPMRVLVEQTRDCARAWLQNLGILAQDAPQRHPPGKVGVHVLMGGDLELGWDHWPERDQLLIGTQDMLLSRALNRGYAMSRFRWPLQFGLLNSDCLWVMDEVQLMGCGLATTTQLQAFRRQLGTLAPVRSLWMSATVDPSWLDTVDFEVELDAAVALSISDEDRDRARQRLEAPKPLEQAGFFASPKGRQEAALALARHTPGTRTLLVVNSVRRAQEIYLALRKSKASTAELVLLHSRFRQAERDRALARLVAPPGGPGTIAVCTQVVEAGVDVSARLLISDLAPWSSMVQRFGRCNRRGEYGAGEAAAVWVAPPNLADHKKLKPAPYAAEELQASAARLERLTDVGPANLPAVTDPMIFAHVPRRKDLLELFDTTPDLAGADVDVSRFIREQDERQVQVFWRGVSREELPGPDEPGPDRQELCGAPLAEVNLRKRAAWRWDHLQRRWVRPETLFPGLALMLSAAEGGYDPELGWSPRSKKEVAAIGAPGSALDANDRDPWSEGARQTIAAHTDAVVRAVQELLRELGPVGDPWAAELLLAARWHDAGKAHAVFQGAMPEDSPPGAWAKAGGQMARYARPGFRHELASALAMLGRGLPDLCAYLAAAHHGKVRLSIRSLPHESADPDDPGRRFARGVREGDALPEADLGGGVTLPPTDLSLAYMELGEDEATGPSWLARTLALRDAPDLGPFRLACLEALLRVADWRGSADSTQEDQDA